MHVGASQRDREVVWKKSAVDVGRSTLLSDVAASERDVVLEQLTTQDCWNSNAKYASDPPVA